MTPEEQRCAEARRFERIDRAFHRGDMGALRAALDDPPDFPNCPMPLSVGPCLAYAVYHSPVPFIGELIALGAELNPTDHDGFPPLIAALTCSRSAPGSPARPDVNAVVALLLDAGVDPNQRGFNDYTALHQAVVEDNLEALTLILDAGADPRIRTRIDDVETPRELAEAMRKSAFADVLAEAERRWALRDEEPA